MKNIIIGVLAIVLVVVLVAIAVLTFSVVLPPETEIIDETGQAITITGVVYENVQEVPADGNNFLMVDVENGRRIVLYEEGGLVPADMADEQCNQNPLVAQLAQTIQVGDTVEVSGAINAEGNIEVCSSTEYSITVINSDSAEDDEMQTTRQVSGTVVELISDCAFDGNCAYIIETETGERVTVIWSEGMSPICQNDPFQGGDTDIAVGNTLEALGRVIDENTISGCGDPSYFITKTG